MFIYIVIYLGTVIEYILYIIKADLFEVLLSPASTYFPFNMVWIKANVKGKINPEVN